MAKLIDPRFYDLEMMRGPLARKRMLRRLSLAGQKLLDDIDQQFNEYFDPPTPFPQAVLDAIEYVEKKFNLTKGKT